MRVLAAKEDTGNSGDLGAARVAMVNGAARCGIRLAHIRARDRAKKSRRTDPEDRERVTERPHRPRAAGPASRQGRPHEVANSGCANRAAAIASWSPTPWLPTTSRKIRRPTPTSRRSTTKTSRACRASNTRLRHILVTTRDEAEAVIAQLRQGADFIALAEERADGPTGPNGGALGWLTADSMPPPFAAGGAGNDRGFVHEGARGDRVWISRDPARGNSRQEPPAIADIRADLASAAERKRLDDYIKTSARGGERYGRTIASLFFGDEVIDANTGLDSSFSPYLSLLVSFLAQRSSCGVSRRNLWPFALRSASNAGTRSSRSPSSAKTIRSNRPLPG